MKRQLAEEIFNQIYDQTFHEVFGFILAKTGDIASTPSILKSSYAELYKKLLRLRKDTIENKRNFLFKLVRQQVEKYNKTISKSEKFDLKKSKNKIRESRLLNELDTDFPKPKNREELSALLSEIIKTVSTKPVMQQRAFMFYFLYDYSVADIAAALSISKSETLQYIYSLTREINNTYNPQNAAQ